MSANPSMRVVDVATTSYWRTLEELQNIALNAGCTKAQFAEAIETMGTNPSRVANYLQRYSLAWHTSTDID